MAFQQQQQQQEQAQPGYPNSYYAGDSPPPSPPGSFFEHDLPPKKRPTFPVALSVSGWLSHRSQSSSASSNNNNNHAPQSSNNLNNNNGPTSTVRISEPMISNAFDVFAPNQRFKAAVHRTLGMGAQVVRTPNEALANITVVRPVAEEDEYEHVDENAARRSIGSESSISLPDSPIISKHPYSFSPHKKSLPPITKSSSLDLQRKNTPPKPKRAPPPAPAPAPAPVPDVFDVPALRSSLKSSRASSIASPSHNNVIELPPIPNFRPISGFTPTSSSLSLSQPPPPFTPVLVSPCSNPKADPTQIIIQLETASSSLCTTMHTLTAIPSRLSEYLTTFVPTTVPESPPASPSPSPESPFSTAFQAHQESMGLRASVPPPPKQPTSTSTSSSSPSDSSTTLPPLTNQTNTRMHIFLDRPSAPYIHILAFLRNITASTLPALPRGLLQMPASAAVRMEALFEVREEARYLGMSTLERLVEEEIVRRQGRHGNGLVGHGHGHGHDESTSGHSTHGSMSSNESRGSLLRDVVERPMTTTAMMGRSSTNVVSNSMPVTPAKSLPPSYSASSSPMNLDRARSPPPFGMVQSPTSYSYAHKHTMSPLRIAASSSSTTLTSSTPPLPVPITSPTTTTTTTMGTGALQLGLNLTSSSTSNLPRLGDMDFEPPRALSALATRPRSRSVTRTPMSPGATGRI